MTFTCRITKATDTHSEYIILIAFPRQQWLSENSSIWHLTYIGCLVFLYICFRFSFKPRLKRHCTWNCSYPAVNHLIKKFSVSYHSLFYARGITVHVWWIFLLYSMRWDGVWIVFWSEGVHSLTRVTHNPDGTKFSASSTLDCLFSLPQSFCNGSPPSSLSKNVMLCILPFRETRDDDQLWRFCNGTKYHHIWHPKFVTKCCATSDYPSKIV